MNSVWRLQDQKSCFDAMVVMALSGRSNRTFLPTSPHEQPINKEVVFCYRWYTEEVVKVLSVQYMALVQNRGDVVLPRVTLARIMDQWAFSLSSRVDIHLSDHYFPFLPKSNVGLFWKLFVEVIGGLVCTCSSWLLEQWIGLVIVWIS